jgi:hypothetical protein
MKYLLTLLLLAGSALAQHTHTIFVVDTVSQHTEAHQKLFGTGVAASSREHHSAPREIAELSKKCPAAKLTQDRTGAEFILETGSGSSILEDAKGNVLYVSSAKLPKNQVKDICEFITKQ